MHAADLAILAVYFVGLVGVGAWFSRRQTDVDAYFVGNREMGAGHVGLSIVATDVGGGFSIGLGGLGFAMGISASWLLFTGLVGAWLAAVFLIPRVRTRSSEQGWLTYPDFLEDRFDGRTRSLAAAVSGIGYAGFVGAQVLAGAKLASVAFDLDQTLCAVIMAAVVIGYTALGGLQAVIATDTVQWAVLLIGLLVSVPLALSAAGGLDQVRAALPPGHLDLFAIEGTTLLSWALTIIPIWFVANTLYQRIYATRDAQTARRAFLVAGLLEYPLLAFLGTILGVLARVLFPEVEPELGLPTLIREVLPVGAVGLVLAVYLSAILSTADSCLLAAAGHVVTDLYMRVTTKSPDARRILQLTRWVTVGIGVASMTVALALPNVLDAILLAYAFMVSGLFVPTVAGLATRRASSAGALTGMISGGTTALILSWPGVAELLPAGLSPSDPVFIAMPMSLVGVVLGSLLWPSAAAPSPPAADG